MLSSRSMARKRRWFIPGVSAHLIKRGNNRAPVFSRGEDYEHFLGLVRNAAERHDTAVHAYVLMTNHIHLIATPESETSIPGFMKHVAERYSWYFNTTYDRSGTPWDGRYRALLLLDERYWLTCLRYVEQNPVRAGMVLRAEDYAWSSFRTHALGESQEWLHGHPSVRSARRVLGRARRSLPPAICSASQRGGSTHIAQTRWCAAHLAAERGSDPGV